MSILKTIVAHKKKEVESCKELIPVCELKKMPFFSRQSYGFRESILNPLRTGIIAEFKRKSPSKGIINDTADVQEVAAGYAKYGASAVSVLTDFNFFGGSPDDLLQAREVLQIPILRKEFIIDAYQVYEAKAIGADAILLIASILNDNQARELACLAHDLGLQVLMEVHKEKELDLLNDYIDVVGVNNRDLDTFEVSLEQSAVLSALIPDRFLKISESGITSAKDIRFLKRHGFSGFLIGENFMKTSNPVASFTSFTESLKPAAGR
jgi:indole-3-glycerol phosphate synthase